MLILQVSKGMARRTALPDVLLVHVTSPFADRKRF
jgi:hypothetical protein